MSGNHELGPHEGWSVEADYPGLPHEIAPELNLSTPFGSRCPWLIWAGAVVLVWVGCPSKPPNAISKSIPHLRTPPQHYFIWLVGSRLRFPASSKCIGRECASNKNQYFAWADVE